MPRRPAFVGVADAADHLGGGVVHDCKPDFVDHGQVMAEQCLNDLPDAVVSQGSVEWLGQVGSGEVADLVRLDPGRLGHGRWL
jgi:hypothetical protein